MIRRIAHAGHDRVLMKMRSVVLRDAGFSVDEADTLRAVLTLVEVADALLICHTLRTWTRRCSFQPCETAEAPYLSFA